MQFINSNFTLEESNVVVFGIPLGRNSLNTLDSLRYASQFVEPMDLYRDINLLENVKTHDTGNIELNSLDKITEQTKEVLGMNKVPLILGGNHLISFYSMKLFDNIKLIVFDAHGDFKNSYQDEKIEEMDYAEGIDFNPKINDATWLRRISEIMKPENILLLGVRSCDEFEFNDLKKSGIKYFTSMEIKEDTTKVVKAVKDFTTNSDIYVSLDVDVFDPSIVPAVDMPEPDGIFFNDFQKIVRGINGRITGIDVCCLKSDESSEISEFLVVRSIFEILSLVK